jgi:hypothetical protein
MKTAAELNNSRFGAGLEARGLIILDFVVVSEPLSRATDSHHTCDPGCCWRMLPRNGDRAGSLSFRILTAYTGLQYLEFQTIAI